MLHRLRRFMRKPLREKAQSFTFRWVRHFPAIPLPIRLPFGAWWLARNDFCGAAILGGGFEVAECEFVRRILQLGMTVLDIGAHHGFYTLLASLRVGPRGRVVAFEPSPRERRLLWQHLRLNRCRNVSVESFALGSQPTEAELFLVEGRETGCNSLRPPSVNELTRAIRVPVQTLDNFLRQGGIGHVDFIKMDVEGAELEVLRGATELLNGRERPVILCEVQGIRTLPWGYAAEEIVVFLRQFGFTWFRPLLDGNLEPISSEQGALDGNFVAVPEDKLNLLNSLGLGPATATTGGKGS